MKSWPKPKSICDIQVFIGFANFYQHFIKGFSRITAPLTSILKTTGLFGLAPRKTEDKVVGGGGGRVDKTMRNLFKSRNLKNNKSGNLMHVPTIKAMGKLIFLTPEAKEIFNYLKQSFIKALILRHFDLKSHIRIETDASGYAIGGVLSQLSSDWVAPDKPNLAKKSVKNLTKSNFG